MKGTPSFSYEKLVDIRYGEKFYRCVGIGICQEFEVLRLDTLVLETKEGMRNVTGPRERLFGFPI